MRTSPHAQLLHEQLASAAQRTFSGTEIVLHLTQTGTERPYAGTLEAEIVSIASEAQRMPGTTPAAGPCGSSATPGPEAAWVCAMTVWGFDPSQPAPMRPLGSDRHAGAGCVHRARLTVTSAPGAGTEVILARLSVPWAALWSRLVRRNFVPL
jgi:hypothetical protein